MVFSIPKAIVESKYPGLDCLHQWFKKLPFQCQDHCGVKVECKLVCSQSNNLDFLLKVLKRKRAFMVECPGHFIL